VYWLLVDLAELPILNTNLMLFSYNKPNLISFYDRDHGDGSATTLLEQALRHLRAAGIDDTGVSVQLLCMPRVAGYDFNPLSIYFCKDADDRTIAVIYEVSNTYGGRHSYVIAAHVPPGDVIRQTCAKTFYVSPFMDLELRYRFRATAPALASGFSFANDKVRVSVQARKGDHAVINTSLVGRYRELTDFNLLQLTFTHPLLPLKVTGAIYWNALKLWLRGFAVNPVTPSRATTVTIVRPNE
jgi:DUF1365 family protein